MLITSRKRSRVLLIRREKKLIAKRATAMIGDKTIVERQMRRDMAGDGAIIVKEGIAVEAVIEDAVC